MLFVDNGDGYLAILLNSFVHFVMYGYYLIVLTTGQTPPWKRLVTVLQQTQFIIMMTQVCTQTHPSSCSHLAAHAFVIYYAAVGASVVITNMELLFDRDRTC